MRSTWMRLWKMSTALSTGGLTLGLLSGIPMIDWAGLLTTLLVSWVSVLVTLLLGGDVSQALYNNPSFA